MKYLPASLGNLTKLEYLDVSYNQLEELPPEIGRLVNLRELYLENNNLASLPDSIVNIVNLDHWFDVWGYKCRIAMNHICSLPNPVKLWADTIIGTNWEGTQCSDCPLGGATCESSIVKPMKRTLPEKDRQPASGYLFDLRGKWIGAVAGKKEIFRLPKGCYIVRYGGAVPQYRRIAVP